MKSHLEITRVADLLERFTAGELREFATVAQWVEFDLMRRTLLKADRSTRDEIECYRAGHRLLSQDESRNLAEQMGHRAIVQAYDWYVAGDDHVEWVIDQLVEFAALFDAERSDHVGITDGAHAGQPVLAAAD